VYGSLLALGTNGGFYSRGQPVDAPPGSQDDRGVIAKLSLVLETAVSRQCSPMARERGVPRGARSGPWCRIVRLSSAPHEWAFSMQETMEAHGGFAAIGVAYDTVWDHQGGLPIGPIITSCSLHGIGEPWSLLCLPVADCHGRGCHDIRPLYRGHALSKLP
jgi:hypothetical protein